MVGRQSLVSRNSLRSPYKTTCVKSALKTKNTTQDHQTISWISPHRFNLSKNAKAEIPIKIISIARTPIFCRRTYVMEHQKKTWHRIKISALPRWYHTSDSRTVFFFLLSAQDGAVRTDWFRWRDRKWFPLRGYTKIGSPSVFALQGYAGWLAVLYPQMPQNLLTDRMYDITSNSVKYQKHPAFKRSRLSKTIPSITFFDFWFFHNR